MNGDLLLLPEANPSIDDGFQPFDGRLGKLRYLALALMVSTSPVAKEVIHLAMSFPEPEHDPFDFDAEERSSIKRAPVAYPILCGHVLTHTTVALLAVAGSARAEEEKQCSIDTVVNDCRHLMQIGLIARLAQTILARLRSNFGEGPVWEQQVCAVIEHNMAQTSTGLMDADEQEWRYFGTTIIQVLLSSTKSESQTERPLPKDADRIASQIFHAIELAKIEAIDFLMNLSVICQMIVPNIFCAYSSSQEDGQQCENSLKIFRRCMSLLGLETDPTILESDLLQEIMKSWYSQAVGKNTNKLDFPRVFRGSTWPCISQQHDMDRKNDMPSTCLPLLGNCTTETNNGDDMSSRILYLPKSYTDLYAELSEMYPDSEQTALCLVCGQVLNASGKGECTKHAYQCGGGAGMFFLLQECVGLIMHGQKAAYVHSPYVDCHGETPQYRGRPLNLDMGRYRILQSLWSGHLLREKVMAERASTRQVIVPNFY